LWATSSASLTSGLVATGATEINKSGTGITEIGSTAATSRTVIGNTSMNGGIDINTATAATSLTTIGSATSRTVIGNVSTANITVTGRVWATGATEINKTGTGITEIGSTTTGSRTVIGNTSIIGGVDINTGESTTLTTIGSATSRTVIGNMSTSNTTVTGSLWATGATAINKLGTAITEIGSTEFGARTVIGNTSMNGSVDINTNGTGITTIGSILAGSRTVIGNTSMNGSIDINTSGTGITTMGSATSSTVVKGDMSVTKLLTTGYTPSLYNYAPTFFATGFSGGNVSFSNGPDYGFTLTAAKANVSSISPVSFMANKKYIVNFNARADSGTEVTILGAPAFTPAATNTLYRQVITPTGNNSTLALDISGAIGNKVSWNLLTIEPFYDMTLGSNQISLGGEINVSAGNPVTDWDPTRMLFTTSTISIGTNPRIAIGKNSATNTSTFVATCDSAVNASFFSSTDGVTWGQGNFTAVTNPRGIAYNEINSTFYMITGESPAKVWTSTAGSSGWSTFSTTGAINSVTNMIYGNGNLVAFNSGTSGNIMNIATGSTWSVTTNQVPKTITDIAYGKIGSAHLFVACATDSFYRNTNSNQNGYAAVDWGAATTSQPGTWAFVGFGNNKFIAASNDATGKVSHSIDGLNWQTPILLNEILTSKPIYLEDTWFIGSNTGVYVSKDNGLTWTKRVGNSLTRSVYGGRFVDVGTSLSLITKRNQRTDGSTISPDVITIGAEGATTVIGDALVVRNNGVSLAGIVNASSGPVTTEAPFTYTNSYYTISNPRIAYGNGVFILCGDNKVYRSIYGTTWTVSTTLTTGLFKGVAYGNGVFMIIAQGATGVNSLVWTSSDGSTWNSGTATIPGVSNLTFGNGVFIAGSSNNGDTSISVTTGTGSFTWSPKTVSGIAGVNNVMFGAMSNGTNVFISTGSGVRRSIDNGSTWQNPTTGVANNLGIRACGFGNDVFMVSTWDTSGLISISRDGANNWSTVGVFNLTINMFLYVEKKWYVGTDSNIILISKDDGTTWTKVEGPKFSVCVYGNSIFAVAWTDQQSVIKFKTNRSDGSAITSDTITIGREGTNATIAADTLTMPSKVYVPPATLTSEGGLTFSTDQQLMPTTYEYENLGQRSNKVRIQTFSLSIMDPPSYYNGKNIVSGFTTGQNTQSGAFNVGTGEYTYTTTAVALGNINPNFTATVGQTYKAVVTLYTTTPTATTTVQIRDSSNGCLLDLGYIGTGYKTYVGYFTARTASLLIGVYSGGGFVTAAAKTVVIKHFSLELLDSPNVLDVTGRIGLSEPITIGYTIPTLNTQLGYYTSNTFAGDTITGLGSGKSFCPVGPILPGIYQVNVAIHFSGSSRPYYTISSATRPTPFIQNDIIVGLYTVHNDGLYRTGYIYNDDINQQLGMNLAGFIRIQDGSLDRYACLRLYMNTNTNISSATFSLVRIA
jgi:hypothetical protein